MLRKFYYLDIPTLDGYLSALEDGLRSTSSRTSGRSGSIGGRIDVRVASVTGGRDDQASETKELVDTAASRFERLLACCDTSPDDAGWIELPQLEELADAGHGALVSAECELYVPDAVKMLSPSGEAASAVGLMKDLMPLAGDLGLDLDGIPDASQLGAMSKLLNNMSSDLVVVGEDDSDWKIAARLSAQHIQDQEIDGFFRIVGKVASRWPENRWKPLLALPGAGLLPRRERKALESESALARRRRSVSGGPGCHAGRPSHLSISDRDPVPSETPEERSTPRGPASSGQEGEPRGEETNDETSVSRSVFAGREYPSTDAKDTVATSGAVDAALADAARSVVRSPDVRSAIEAAARRNITGLGLTGISGLGSSAITGAVDAALADAARSVVRSPDVRSAIEAAARRNITGLGLTGISGLGSSAITGAVDAALADAARSVVRSPDVRSAIEAAARRNITGLGLTGISGLGSSAITGAVDAALADAARSVVRSPDVRSAIEAAARRNITGLGLTGISGLGSSAITGAVDAALADAAKRAVRSPEISSVISRQLNGVHRQPGHSGPTQRSRWCWRGKPVVSRQARSPARGRTLRRASQEPLCPLRGSSRLNIQVQEVSSLPTKSSLIPLQP
ncbi:MAG: hypothetical protein QM747_05615 [Nocardioides sp.]